MSKNDTIVSDVVCLGQDDLVELYEKLAESYKRLKTENEENLQQIHQSKQKLKILVSSQNDFQNEFDSVSVNHRKELEEVVRKNASVVETLKAKNHELESDKVVLESQVLESQEKLQEAQSNCELLKEKLAEQKPRPRISDSFSTNLERENEHLQLIINEYTEKMTELEQKLADKHERLEELNEKILCLEDNFESKKAEVEEKNDTIEGLQEKVQELTVELALLKSNPEDADRKGNSLFAEVDDQRKKMKTMLQGERGHYLEMKKAYNSKEMEIRRLKRENMNIKQEIQACSNLLNRGQQLALQTLSAHVNQLKNDNKKLERLLVEMEAKLFDLAKEQNLGWIESVLSSANNETRDLKDKVFSLMVDKTSLAENCEKNMRELAKVRLDCVKLKICLGRIVDLHSIKLNEDDFYDIGLDHDVLANLKTEEFESLEESNILSPNNDSATLSESTIKLLGGRSRLGNFAPEIKITLPSPDKLKNDDKENIKSPPVNLPSPKKSPLKQVQPTDDVKSVKFSDAVETKVIDNTREGYEMSKLARKRPGVVVKRIVIPSKAPAKKIEKI